MNYTIDEARVTRLMNEAHLRSGAGNGANGEIDVCMVQAADWIAGGNGKSDAPACVDPAIRNFCIKLNDAPRFAQWRDELKPFIPRIIGTSQGRAATEKRAFMCADWAIRTIAPLAFEFWADAVPAKREIALDWAKQLREVEPIVDKTTARNGRDVAQKARGADAAADAAAYAADAAAAAADAAADAAAYAAYTAAAYAAAYAAAAADAAAAAAAAYRVKSDEFSRKLWELSLAQLDAMIAVTEKIEA